MSRPSAYDSPAPRPHYSSGQSRRNDLAVRRVILCDCSFMAHVDDVPRLQAETPQWRDLAPNEQEWKSCPVGWQRFG
jgi:hypothetical protein